LLKFAAGVINLPQLANSIAAVNVNGDISDNRHSRPTVFVSFYALALRFAAQNMLTTAAILPWSLLD